MILTVATTAIMSHGRSFQHHGHVTQWHRLFQGFKPKRHLLTWFCHYTTSSPSARKVQDCDAEQLYRYTSGRWLWNEKDQFARRYVKFDLTGLLEISAKAVGARRCVQIEKLPEGNFNKVFLLIMDIGKRLIAKLPNPNAGRPHYTTASEVATMDYVRALYSGRNLITADPTSCCRFVMFSWYRRQGSMAGAPRRTILLGQSTF